MREEYPIATVTTVDWSEVKAKYLDIYNGKTPGNFRGLEVDHYRRGQRDEYGWLGCSADEMAEWVQFGYRAENEFAPEYEAPARKSRRLRFSEDGELDLGLAFSGHDYPFLEWDTRERKPGVKVTLEYVFSAAVDAKTVGAYGEWAARMLGGLETQGYDMEVNIEWDTRGLFVNNSRDRVDRVLIRVKREGEAMDFAEWSALLSPGGFRILCFIATAIAAEKNGTRVTAGLGGVTGKDWGIDWEPDSRELRIRAKPAASGKFPAAEMDEKVKAALK